MIPTLEWEKSVGFPQRIVVGVDEVGRGCLAGPVVAGALVLPADCSAKWVAEIRDSKELTPETRGRLAPLIQGWAQASAIGVASVEEIDRINIYHAAHLAMCRAIEALGVEPDHILFDGNAIPRELRGTLRSRSLAIIKGDQKCLSIAAASIIAKVWRDAKMVELDAEYPGYGFGGHKGYSTPAHQKKLKELGPCAIHRRSFAPVAELLDLSSALSQ